MRNPFPKRTVRVVFLTAACLLFFACAQVARTEKEPSRQTLPDAGQAREVPPSPSGTSPRNCFMSDGRYYYYVEAQLHRRGGRLDKALEYMRKAIESDPGSPYLKKELALFYQRQNNRPDAMEVMREAVESDPDDTEMLIMYGKLNQGLRQTDEAKAAYEKVIARDPLQRDIYLLLGGLYADEGDMGNAARVYEQMLGHFPEFYAGHFYLGKIHMERGRLGDAERAFLKTLELDPDLEEPRAELLKIYDIQNREDKAVRLCKDILADDPEDVRALMSMAYFHHKNGRRKRSGEMLAELGKRSLSDPDIVREVFRLYVIPRKHNAAEVILRGMLEGAPESSDLHYAAGIAFNELGRKDQAVPHFEKVGPDSGFFENAAVQVAFLHQEAGRLREAIRFLEGAVRRMPDNTDFMLYLGGLYEDSEEYGKAEDVLRRGIALEPDNARLHFRMGVVYDKWGRKADCIESMKTSVRLNPQDPNSLNYLGYTYADLGENLDEAERLITEALRRRQDDGYITDSLGWVYFKKGLYDKAAAVLEKAAGLVPDDPVILEHLGDAYMKLDRKSEALEFYKRSLSKKEKDKDSLERKIRELEAGNAH